MNVDILLHIGSFMPPRDAVAITNVNRETRKQRGPLLREVHKRTFGEIDHAKIQQADTKIVARLLCWSEQQPDISVNHNVYRPPTNYFEQWKWIVGVDNCLDREVQESYDFCMQLLGNTRAVSILQLKNQIQAFWHTTRQVKDYEKFKETARTVSWQKRQFFFSNLGRFLKKHYNPAVLRIGKKLEIISSKIFAKIGSFQLDGQDYNVIAFHVCADEKKESLERIYQDDSHRAFASLSFGKTNIAIVRDNQIDLALIGAQKHFSLQFPHFKIWIGREIKEGCNQFTSSEISIGHGKEAVTNKKRHLIISRELRYCESDNKGSDRILDQKLTQVMIEVLMQNHKIISLQVDSMHDDLAVLAASGFVCDEANKMIEHLIAFRSQKENKLFPPYKDYGGIATKFYTEDFTKKNVYYSKETVESWADIIEKSPILKPNSAVLPEYWARKPNIVEMQNNSMAQSIPT